jgi:hypothetical protein
MLLSKKKIKVNDLAALLYISTIDSTQLDNFIEKLSNIKTLDRSKVFRELILLKLIIVCYLLSSNKLFASNRDRITRLQLEYLEHFEADEDKFDGEIPFVDLFESRMKIYKPIIEHDCFECAIEIGKIITDNCGIETSHAFVYMIKNYYLNSLLKFKDLILKYRLI